jgi:hypothetical protein
MNPTSAAMRYGLIELVVQIEVAADAARQVGAVRIAEALDTQAARARRELQRVMQQRMREEAGR